MVMSSADFLFTDLGKVQIFDIILLNVLMTFASGDFYLLRAGLGLAHEKGSQCIFLSSLYYC